MPWLSLCAESCRRKPKGLHVRFWAGGRCRRFTRPGSGIDPNRREAREPSISMTRGPACNVAGRIAMTRLSTGVVSYLRQESRRRLSACGGGPGYM